MTELVHRYVEVWNTQQVEKLTGIFSESASYKDSLQEGNAIEFLKASINETAKAFPDISFEILAIIEGSGDNIFVLEWLMKGTNQGSFFQTEPTNKEIQIAGVDIIKVKHNKISTIKSFYDSSQFETQLGI